MTNSKKQIRDRMKYLKPITCLQKKRPEALLKMLSTKYVDKSFIFKI